MVLTKQSKCIKIRIYRTLKLNKGIKILLSRKEVEMIVKINEKELLLIIVIILLTKTL
jgi:hypothetical protein